MDLSKQLDTCLLNLIWSLWTELGVAGVKQNHQNVLILIEELVIFTSVLTQIDPRLRDESLDWCSKFYRFISVSRLKSLMKNFEELAREPFSTYASTLNNISNANWPVFIDSTPLKINLSHKSILRAHDSSALLNIRARSLFGTGARADLVTFFLVHPDIGFSISEITETGYSKRNLAEVLDDLYLSNLFDRFMQGNQYRYRLNKHSHLFQMLKPIPEHAPSWHVVFKLLLTLRTCIHNTEKHAESTKVVTLRSCLQQNEKSLQKLKLTPPLFQNNFSMYLESFTEWIFGWIDLLTKGQNTY